MPTFKGYVRKVTVGYGFKARVRATTSIEIRNDITGQTVTLPAVSLTVVDRAIDLSNTRVVATIRQGKIISIESTEAARQDDSYVMAEQEPADEPATPE